MPKVNPDEYLLEIEGLGLEQTVELTLEQLKTLFPKHTITSVIQCGGNRRDDLNKVCIILLHLLIVLIDLIISG